MKPSKFGVFLTRSARYGKTFQVHNAAHKALVTRADTTPEMGHYELGTTTYEFMFRGKASSKTIPLTGTLKDGRTCFWDVSPSWPSEKASFAQEVARERAELTGGDYVLFEGQVLGSTYEEVKNRQTAQCYLFQARDFETHELETAILLALVRGPGTIQELAQASGHSVVVTTVAVLRLWLKCRVEVPLTTQLLQPGWNVRRRDDPA